MAVRACDQCGTEYEAASPRSRFCDAKCRKRSSRKSKPGGADAAAPPSAPPAPPAPHLGPCLMSTMTTLVEAGRHETPGGTAALALAMRIDFPHGETGSSLAALVREHRAQLADALQGAKVKGDPLDEIDAKRRAKLAS